jgi:hypothetical protein
MTTGVWDGFVPYVMGSPQSIPNCFTVRVNALRVLRDEWPSIIDAIEPGGNGDPYAGLNDEERGALEEATRTGFPAGAWFNCVLQGGGPIVLVQLCAAVGPDVSRRLLEQAGLPRHRPDVVGPRGEHPTRGDSRRPDFRRPDATDAVERPHG